MVVKYSVYVGKTSVKATPSSAYSMQKQAYTLLHST
jgi:hypothetical protein